jgi:hypothetical protein
MPELDRFPAGTNKSLKYYVYRLMDPRNGITFYVGMGTGNQIFSHAQGNLRMMPDDVDTNDPKLALINEIRASGLEVIAVMHRWGLDEATAFEVESAVMDCFLGLTDRRNGQHHDRGTSNVQQLIKGLSPEIYPEPPFKYVLIKTTDEKIARCDADGEEDPIFAACHEAWKLNLDIAMDYDYVITSVKGVVRGVYQVVGWYPVAGRVNRIGFLGHRAEPKIWDGYVGKRIPDVYRRKGAMNPALYSQNRT